MFDTQDTTALGIVMETPTENELRLAFPKAKYGGYLYIILFDSGVTKPGRTQDPAQRIRNHASNASAFSTGISKVWVSPHHDNYADNEAVLVGQIASIASKQNKREYFEGASFEESVGFARSLTFDAVNFEAHEERAMASAEAWKQFLSREFGESVTKPENPMMAWGSPILKMFAQVKLMAEIDDSESDPDVMRELWSKTATAMGRTYEEVMAMSYLDVLEHLASTFVRTAYLDTKIWAFENGRSDLTASMGERYGS